MVFFEPMLRTLLQGTHGHSAFPVTARACLCSSSGAGHLPWPLSLLSQWHFSPLLDETNYLFSPQECVSYVTVNVATKETLVWLSFQFTLKSWGFILRPFCFLLAFKIFSSRTVIVFCCRFWYESVCTWHPCQSVLFFLILYCVCHCDCTIVSQYLSHSQFRCSVFVLLLPQIQDNLLSNTFRDFRQSQRAKSSAEVIPVRSYSWNVLQIILKNRERAFSNP